ncbi:MAG: type IV pilus assembly protein PilM [Proteobacteria bacterium]|nr:MAG: type IV pilus assembly protein PilM [Pseudomonadota bacterium]
MQIPFFFSGPLLAIDFGSSSIKVMEMTSGKSGKLHTLGLELLPRGVIENGQIRDADTVARSLKKLLARLGIKTKNRRVAISIAGLTTLIKRVSMAVDDNSDLDEAIFEEAKQRFAHNLEDMYFRFEEISSSFVTEGEKAFILVAARIDTVEQHIDLIHKAGMKVGITDCDFFCLSNMFDFNYPIADSLTMAINLGASSTQIVFLFNGEFLYSREIFMGGHDITQRVADFLKLDFESAETLKISASMGDQAIGERIRGAIQEINDQLAAEIHTTVTYFMTEEMTGRFEKVDHIFLCGGAASTLNLGTTLSSVLRAPVQTINPFQRVDIQPSGIDMDYIMTQGSLFGISVGLGLRDISEIK